MKICYITYTDVAYWAEYATHAHKFIVVKKQCERLMGALNKKPTVEQIDEFGRRYKISWNSDHSFDLIPA